MFEKFQSSSTKNSAFSMPHPNHEPESGSGSDSGRKVKRTSRLKKVIKGDIKLFSPTKLKRHKISLSAELQNHYRHHDHSMSTGTLTTSLNLNLGTTSKAASDQGSINLDHAYEPIYPHSYETIQSKRQLDKYTCCLCKDGFRTFEYNEKHLDLKCRHSCHESCLTDQIRLQINEEYTKFENTIKTIPLSKLNILPICPKCNNKTFIMPVDEGVLNNIIIDVMKQSTILIKDDIGLKQIDFRNSIHEKAVRKNSAPLPDLPTEKSFKTLPVKNNSASDAVHKLVPHHGYNYNTNSTQQEYMKTVSSHLTVKDDVIASFKYSLFSPESLINNHCQDHDPTLTEGESEHNDLSMIQFKIMSDLIAGIHDWKNLDISTFGSLRLIDFLFVSPHSQPSQSQSQPLLCLLFEEILLLIKVDNSYLPLHFTSSSSSTNNRLTKYFIKGIIKMKTHLISISIPKDNDNVIDMNLVSSKLPHIYFTSPSNALLEKWTCGLLDENWKVGPKDITSTINITSLYATPYASPYPSPLIDYHLIGNSSGFNNDQSLTTISPSLLTSSNLFNENSFNLYNCENNKRSKKSVALLIIHENNPEINKLVKQSIEALLTCLEDNDRMRIILVSYNEINKNSEKVYLTTDSLNSHDEWGKLLGNINDRFIKENGRNIFEKTMEAFIKENHNESKLLICKYNTLMDYAQFFHGSNLSNNNDSFEIVQIGYNKNSAAIHGQILPIFNDYNGIIHHVGDWRQVFECILEIGSLRLGKIKTNESLGQDIDSGKDLDIDLENYKKSNDFGIDIDMDNEKIRTKGTNKKSLNSDRKTWSCLIENVNETMEDLEYNYNKFKDFEATNITALPSSSYFDFELGIPSPSS